MASSDPHYLRRVSLKMYWDGESEPSVAMPLGDFFGNGFDKTHYTAVPMGISSGGFYSYLPMPFRTRARLVAENGTGDVLDAFYFNASVERGVKLPEPLATFHAVWNRNARTGSRLPHPVLRARVAAYRWHLLDPVRFRDSVRVELEHGHANEVLADYATTAYWYQTEPHAPISPRRRTGSCWT